MLVSAWVALGPQLGPMWGKRGQIWSQAGLILLRECPDLGAKGS